ncbi:hypothetical protein [Streptomyces sp. NPDC046985]|uniref:hypothetical protein n=1 Tax=Streptomyces sp. NPDC046985 TaxID=3155377 RepID=UPI0033F3ED7F
MTVILLPLRHGHDAFGEAGLDRFVPRQRGRVRYRAAVASNLGPDYPPDLLQRLRLKQCALYCLRFGRDQLTA